MAFSMKDKKVIITGGNKGIGAGITKVFSKEGAKVIFTGRNENDGKNFENELKKKDFRRNFLKPTFRVKATPKNFSNTQIKLSAALIS